MFRNLILIGMVVGAASMAGWFSINREGDQTTILINKAEIAEDARRAIDRGRNYLDEREQRYTNQQDGQPEQWNDGYRQVDYSDRAYDDRQYQYPETQYRYDRNRPVQYQAEQYRPVQNEPYYQDQYQQPNSQSPQVYRGQYQR